MDIQHIRYFLEIAKHKSFSKAAEKLFVTQPILTRCVKNMEEELGIPLIIRSTKSFALTDAGQILITYGSQLLLQHQDIYRRIQDVVDSYVGEVNISCPGMLLDMYFPRLVAQFRQQHPNIRINIWEGGSLPVAQDVLDGTADIGVVMLPLDDPKDFLFYPFVKDDVHILVRQDHPFAKEPYVHIRQLKNMDIITYNKDTTLHHTFLHMCHEEGFSPVVAFQTTMPNFLLDTIAFGNYVGVLPAPMLRQFWREDLITVPLRPHFEWELNMITKKGRYLSHAASSFLAFTQEYLSAELQKQKK